MTAESELRAKATSTGFDKVAKDIEKVGKAQKAVVGSTSIFGEGQKKAAQQVGETVEAQEGLNASVTDYTALLTAVNPRLGLFATSMQNAVKIAGDMANQNIDLNAITTKVTASIKANANVLKLVGAGGAVALAVFAIAKAYQKMKEDMEAATEAGKRNREELNKNKREEQDLKDAIEKTADARKRAAPISADVAREETEKAKVIEGRRSDLERSTITQTVGGLAGAGLSIKQLEDIATLVQSGRFEIKSGARVEDTKREALRAVERNQGFLGGTRTRETEQESELRQAARQEAGAGESGSTVSLETLAAQILPDVSEEDIKKAVEIARQFGTLGELLEALRNAQNNRGRREGVLPEPGGPFGLSIQTVDVESEEFLRAQRILQRLSPTGDLEARSDDAADSRIPDMSDPRGLRGGLGGQSMTIVNHNPKYIVSGQAARESAETNGQSLARSGVGVTE